MQKSRINLLVVLLAAIVFYSCGEKKMTEEEYLNKAQTELENKQYQESIGTFRELIKNYPDSKNSIFAYNQIAGIYMENLNDFPSGIQAYKDLYAAFPDTKEGKNALFMVAFTYDEKMQDKDNAVKSYKEFLAKYPEDTDPNEKMSESAKMMIEVLESGKSVEELIEQKIMEQEKNNPPTKEPVKEDGSNIKEVPKKEEKPQVKQPPTGKEGETKTETEKQDKNK
jgi:tetratricopeptide (TPR) repeat protein